MATRILRQYPFVAWETLKPHIRWEQGQHVFCCGGTGSGKSTVAGEFLGKRAQVVVCVSKGMDPIFEQAPYNTYDTIATWPPPRNRPRVLLRPRNGKTIALTRAIKQQVFSHMFDDILLHRGNWCIDIDEEHYMAESLGLKREITDMLEQGRSAGISLWNNTQRPAGIPLATYVNSTHAFLFQSQEEYDVRRLGAMATKFTNADELKMNIDQLDSYRLHEFIYLDRTGVIPPVRSIVGSKAPRGITRYLKRGSHATQDRHVRRTAH
jgi:hypothetical protein